MGGLSGKELQDALAVCASEPIHIPGSIQDHGALIAVDSRTLRIMYASENTNEFLGTPHVELLGKSLDDVFSSKDKHALSNLLRTGAPEGEMIPVGRMTVEENDLWVSACASNQYGIFEFKRFDKTEASSLEDMLRNLSFLSGQISATKSLDELLETAVSLLRSFMGYDRVLIYKLGDEGHGEVVAENAASDVAPLIGLRFPKWDIPEQARAIMATTPLRYFENVDGKKVKVAKLSPELEELDMSAAHLRSVSDIHLTYIKNMKHCASLTLHIVNDGRLWGHISMLHNAPRRPTAAQIQVCYNLLKLISSRIIVAENDLLKKEYKDSDDLRKEIIDNVRTFSSSATFGDKVLRQVMSALTADGAAVLLNNELVVVGDTPSEKNLRKLMNNELWGQDIFASHQLERDNREAASFCGEDFPGVLVVSSSETTTLMLFRRSQAQHIKWAGAPEKGMVKDEGVSRLEPRGSFELFLTTVEGQSQRWDNFSLRFAEDLWSLLVTAERQDMVNRANRQQTLLINELNHRVRNILALIRSLSRETLMHNGSIRSYVRALEARIEAVAAAHDLGAEHRAIGATLKEIIATEAAPYNDVRQTVAFEGPNIGIRQDVAPLFALVIHELMTNATKHGAISNGKGTVHVKLIEGEHGATIDWRETGGPRVAEKRTKGFGTTLIETSVPFEMSGSVTMTFLPEGLHAQIFLPSAILLSPPPENADVAPEFVSPFQAKIDASHLDWVKGNSLLLEDNFIVSLDTASVMKQVGFSSIETVSNLEEAMAKTTRMPVDFAVLDVNLGDGETSAPLARELRRLNIPFIFITGYGEAAPLGEEFRDIPMLKKPLRDDDIARVLLEMADA